MSDYYNPRKTYGLYIPGSPTPFKISRTKIDLFFKCPKCFYLDRVCGIAQPPGYPFSLNAAVDRLLKKEFDLHRAKHTSHPLMKAYGLDAVPFDDPRMNPWRDGDVGRSAVQIAIAGSFIVCRIGRLLKPAIRIGVHKSRQIVRAQVGGLICNGWSTHEPRVVAPLGGHRLSAGGPSSRLASACAASLIDSQSSTTSAPSAWA